MTLPSEPAVPLSVELAPADANCNAVGEWRHNGASRGEVPLGYGLPRFCGHTAGVAELSVLLVLAVGTGLSVAALLMTPPLIVASRSDYWHRR